MTTFDERMKTYENKYVHDKLLEFKVTARRNRLLGEWVAEKLHLSGDEAREYAMEVVQSDLVEVGNNDILGKTAVVLELGHLNSGVHFIRLRSAERAKVLRVIRK